MQEIIEKENIKDIIYEIRGVQVMLDSDLAKLYHVETKRINEAVKNNLNKFPENYSWILTNEELTIFSRSKFSTLKDKKIKRGYNIKYMPRVFTEQGVYMLATILKSKVAVETTLNIIEGFVSMRKYKSQYNNITFINNNSFHDRFIIIDREILYTCGSSFKDLGKKCFSINLLNNKYIKDILNEIM